MEITINNKTYSFQFIEDANVWVLSKSHIEIGSFKLELEIYLNKLPENKIQWADLQKFLSFLNKNNSIAICKTRLKLKKARLGYQVKVTTNQPIAPHARF
jgi:hypothetical protein